MKNELRKKSLVIRKSLNTVVLSEAVMKNLFDSQEYKQAKNILCYYPLDSEDSNKKIFLPRVCGDKLEICPYSEGQIKTGSYNIKEPVTNAIDNTDIIDLVIIPAVAADKNGYRLGYGKGYYDRFLKTNCQNSIKVILCFSQLIYETVYPEQHDVKADIIVTDKNILYIT